MAGDPIDELVRLFGRLPGVGERSATRLAFHVLGGEPEYAQALGAALSQIHERIKRCTTCGNYGAETTCRICADPRRDEPTICIVARVPDLLAIERAGRFRGRYHVLHGLLSPLDGVGPEELRLEALRARCEAEGTRELILATPLNVEGEATAHYVAELFEDAEVTVTRIASGMPHGGELEFTDQVTLGRAFDGRRGL